MERFERESILRRSRLEAEIRNGIVTRKI